MENGLHQNNVLFYICINNDWIHTFFPIGHNSNVIYGHTISSLIDKRKLVFLNWILITNVTKSNLFISINTDIPIHPIFPHQEGTSFCVDMFALGMTSFPAFKYARLIKHPYVSWYTVSWCSEKIDMEAIWTLLRIGEHDLITVFIYIFSARMYEIFS